MIATTYLTTDKVEIKATTTDTLIDSTLIPASIKLPTLQSECYDKKNGCRLTDCFESDTKVVCQKTCNACYGGKTPFNCHLKNLKEFTSSFQ